MSNGWNSDLELAASTCGLTKVQYEKHVAGHEAAHALIAISVGIRIKRINLVAVGTCRATCELDDSNSNLKQSVQICAAGRAFDLIEYESGRIPKILVSGSNRDEAAAMVRLEKNLGSLNGVPAVQVWKHFVKNVQQSLSETGMSVKLEALREIIYHHMTLGSDQVTAAEVQSAFESTTGELNENG